MTDHSSSNYIRSHQWKSISSNHRMFQHTTNKKLTKRAQKNGSTFRRKKKSNLKIRIKKEMKKRGHVENKKLSFF